MHEWLDRDMNIKEHIVAALGANEAVFVGVDVTQ